MENLPGNPELRKNPENFHPCLQHMLWWICLFAQAHHNQNCLGQFHEIPWNQTTDVHRGSILIT